MRIHESTAGTPQAVFKAYERVHTAGNRQPCNLPTIDCAITMMSRVLSIPSVQARLLQADSCDRGANPFDIVSKL